jgi:hypothetical protein
VKKLSVLVALLACSWVLWQTIEKDGRLSHAVLGADETKRECEETALRLAHDIRAGKSPEFRVTGGRIVMKDGAQVLHRCLPDTVKP